METPTIEQHKAKAGKYLTFCLGKESYGIGVLKVREIIKLQAITAVPQLPEHIKGVLNLRGKIIPVIDLRVRFGMGSAENTASTCIIVVNRHEGGGALESMMGVIVDAVEEVSNILESEIENTPSFGGADTARFILGMAKIKGVVKSLIDIDKAIEGDEEFLAHIQNTHA